MCLKGRYCFDICMLIMTIVTLTDTATKLFRDTINPQQLGQGF